MNNNHKEISLLDYVAVIIKRKKIFGVVFGLIVAVVFLGLFIFNSKIYVVKSVVQIGTLERIEEKPGNLFIESPAQVIVKIQEGVLGGDKRAGLKVEATNLSGTSLLLMTVKTDEPEKAQVYLEEVGKDLLEGHREIFDDTMTQMEDNIEQTEELINLMKSRVSGDEGMAQLQIYLNESKQKLAEAQMTRIIKEPIIINNLGRVGYVMILSWTFGLGLLVSLLVVLLKEWWENNHQITS